jgi:dTDP-4-dehydrorhamnose 3,5-epimerase
MTSASASLAGLLSPPREVTGTTGQLLAIVATPKANPDSRGVVRETYRASWFPSIPPVRQLVQSVSGPKVMRGMHLHRSQWDIWRFTQGKALVRLYDPVTTDPAFLHADEDVVIAIPPGIAHGFYTEPGCTLVYALTNEYDGTDEFGFYPFDGLDPLMYDMFKPDYGWPTHHYGLTISERDLRAPRLVDFEK